MKFLAIAVVLGLAANAPAQASGPARPAVARATDVVTYPIRHGDTLFVLNQHYFTGKNSVQRIQQLNRIANPNRIPDGKVLRIPRALLRDEPILAKVESFSGEVTLRPAGAAIAAKTGATIGEGALIETGPNGFVALRLPDDSVVSLPSQSRVRISRLRKVLLTGSLEREFSSETGRMRARVTPMTDPASNFRVRTPLTVSAVRGTEFRVGFDDTVKAAVTQVEDGKVQVADPAPQAKPEHAPKQGDTALMVPAGFGMATTPAGNSGVLALLAGPKLAGSDDLQTEPELHFTLTPVDGATGYRIQIARDAGVLDLVTEETAPSPAFTLPSLAAGTYFARLSAIDGNGLEGLPRTYTFDRVRNSVGGAMGATGAGRERRYLFKWSGVSDGTPQFRFQLAHKDDAAHPLVDEPTGTTTELTVSNLPAGEYAWRVLSIIPHGEKIIRSWSGEQTFEVAAHK